MSTHAANDERGRSKRGIKTVVSGDQLCLIIPLRNMCAMYLCVRKIKVFKN